MDWYYVVDNERIGPVSDEDFQALIDNGTIQPDTLVWNETMEAWEKFRQTTDGEEATDGRVPCAECGNYFSTDDVIQYENAWVCASCKPVFLQKLKEGVNVSGDLRYAGFWIRAAAAIIDGIILWVVQIVVTTPFTLILSGMMGDINQMEDQNFENLGLFMGLQFFLIFLQFGIAIAYETWFVGKYAATPGKMACKIKVIKSDGEKVGYGLAFGRYFGKLVSSIILGIGFIMAGFDGQKRALHDHMCNTRVVYKD